jgi:hypothetical protein
MTVVAQPPRAGQPSAPFFPIGGPLCHRVPLWLSIAFPRLIDATAKATRKSRSTVSLDAERGEKINGKAMDALCGTPLLVACWRAWRSLSSSSAFTPRQSRA